MTIGVNQPVTINLAAGQILSLVCTNAVGSVVRLADTVGNEPYAPVAIAGTNLSFGPYAIPARFQVNVSVGTVTDSIANSTTSILNSLLGSISGDPVNAAHATLVIDPTGTNNSLTYTSVEYGATANDIYIEYDDPGANNATLVVSVVNRKIFVSLATGVAGAITSTAALIATAIAANPASAALVTVANTAANDGTGVVTAMATAAMTGGAGTFGITAGGLLVDTTDGEVWRNSGTLVAPVWTKNVAPTTNFMLIAGAAAGNVAATGIKTTDTLVSVLRMIAAGTTMTGITDLTSQFTIPSADTINNTSGTNTTGDKLLVIYTRY